MHQTGVALGLALVVLGWGTDVAAQEGGRVASAKVARAPAVDGKVDEVWSAATPLMLTAKRVMRPNLGLSTQVELRAVHTDTHLYFLVRWKDSTRDDAAHKPWVWNGQKQAYEEGPEREDMLSLAFELSGTFNPDMLSGEEGVWDVWQWKASRTNPQGQAMDRTHRYTLDKPAGKAKSYTARNGKTIWIARPEDAGDTVEKKQGAPRERQGDRVSQYLPGTPSGSAADVRAKGAWADGWWTLEFERKLVTGQADDTAFDVRKTYRMALAPHDRTGDMDKASGLIELSFQ